MNSKMKRLGGYVVAGVLGAILSSFPVRSDNPLPNGGQIVPFSGTMQATLLGAGVCKGPVSLQNSNIYNCQGGYFGSADVSALYAANNYSALMQIANKLDAVASKLDTLHSDNSGLNTQIQNQIAVFNKQIQKSIANQFAALPAQLVATQAMQNFHDQTVNDALAKFNAPQIPAK